MLVNCQTQNKKQQISKKKSYLSFFALLNYKKVNHVYFDYILNIKQKNVKRNVQYDYTLTLLRNSF